MKIPHHKEKTAAIIATAFSGHPSGGPVNISIDIIAEKLNFYKLNC